MGSDWLLGTVEKPSESGCGNADETPLEGEGALFDNALFSPDGNCLSRRILPTSGVRRRGGDEAAEADEKRTLQR